MVAKLLFLQMSGFVTLDLVHDNWHDLLCGGREASLGISVDTLGHSTAHNTLGSSELASGKTNLLSALQVLRGSVGQVLRRLTDTVEVAEEVDTAVLDSLLDELAFLLVLPECSHEWSLAVSTVMLAHDLADGVGGLAGVVEWDGGDQVVKDMGANNVVEEMGVDEAEVTVNGGGGSTGKVPGLVVVMWEGSVGVLEEGDGNNPVVNPEVWDNVVEDHVPAANHLTTSNEETNHGKNTHNGLANEWELLLLENVRILTPVEVGDLWVWESLVVFLASQVGEKVSWPSEKLVLDAVPEGDHWSILGEMSKFDSSGISLLTAVRLDPGLALVWDESGILLDVSGSLVVGRVGDLPGVEWDQEERVHDHSHDVVESDRLGESAVTALVGQNPDAGEDEALEDRVTCPCNATSELVWNVLDVGGGIGEDGDVEVVTDNVCH